MANRNAPHKCVERVPRGEMAVHRGGHIHLAMLWLAKIFTKAPRLLEIQCTYISTACIGIYLCMCALLALV